MKTERGTYKRSIASVDNRLGYTTSFSLGFQEELGLSQSSQKKDKRHAFRARIIRSTYHLDDTFKIHSYFMKTIPIIGMINQLQKKEKKKEKM